MNLFVFGLGYTALAFVARAGAARERARDRLACVMGTVTTIEKAEALRGDGIETRVFGQGSADVRITADLHAAEAVLVSVPPGASGDPVLNAFADAIAGAPQLRWIGYLSTVGVYGGQDGAWVDETTPPVAVSPRAARRIAAEQAWFALGRRSGKPVQVFRLAGIYGPGRNGLANLANGTARRIVKEGQVFNRIHVEDIAAVLCASLDHPRAGAVYNVTDDEPAPAQDVVAYAAALAGVEPPPAVPFEEADLSPMARSFYSQNRRISNRRIKEELGIRLLYPSYREGLTALRRAGEGP